jgi:predicted RNA-binding Zn-ribbon protein involved in translation (DUF1610 family)
MIKRCTPQIVKKAYLKVHSWRKAAKALNELYRVSLSHATWRDYAEMKRDIADEETRTRLLLGPRACPGCGRKHITRKRSRSRRIREYGYPSAEFKSFDEVLILREPMR